MSSGVSVSDECVEKYNQIKMKKDLKFIIFKIENKKEIIVEKTGEKTASWDDLVTSLPENEPRYGLVDVEYESADGRPQAKLAFLHWSPDDKTDVKSRMLYASSKEAIKKKLAGVMKELQANEPSDLNEDDCKKKML
eukprot:CAMPEP_0197870274 /NCGR_PEP_ID=MMETSP1439-20131203/1022_1 /TAXON_ID=66791 /ORGANISM="Gonyaulax spinifera, Strain CCMP409" /LENGTH=136 /DNA_ID=CAMNT_0043489165 /DNA_START=89 /DNA_END=499 /DNA_ORIENTATION=+